MHIPALQYTQSVKYPQLWGVDKYGDVRRTTDGGHSYTQIPIPAGVDFKDISAASDGTVWATDTNKNIYRFDSDANNAIGEAWINENNDKKFLYVSAGSATFVVG